MLPNIYMKTEEIKSIHPVLDFLALWEWECSIKFIQFF